jgi:hypothetical protein
MKNYFYVGQNGQQCGPVAMEQLSSCGITRETFVWSEGMTEWKKAGEVAELANLFIAVPPTPPTPPTPPAYQAPQPQVSVQQPINTKPAGTCPDSYLVWSILTTILCCWPFGIPAIVNAVKVERLWMAGDYAGAYEKSDAAKKWCWISAIAAVVIYVLYFVLVAAGIMGAEEVMYDSYDYYY